MFRSTQRPLVIPQAEHLKLAGTLALLWGNADFERPPLPFHSVVTGIALHDRGYGPLDTIEIGAVALPDWLAVTRRGFHMPCTDPITDVVARHHLVRLVGTHGPPERQALATELHAALDAQLAQHGLDPHLFAQVDRMTDLCDSIAFDFCFEKPATGTVEVVAHYASDTRVSIHYQIASDIITLAPWPLAVPHYTGYLIGYALDGYPERLEGTLMPFTLRPTQLIRQIPPLTN